MGKVAVVGQRKAWKPIGSGIQKGDVAKFVPMSPFVPFAGLRIQVVKPEVWIPQPLTLVAEQPQDVTLSGTFGLTIIELTAGSVVVNFKLLPSDNIAEPLVHEVLEDLQSQVKDPASALLQAPVIQIKDVANALSFGSDSGIDPSSPFLTFGVGERDKAIEFEIFDDNEVEAHFEFFRLVLQAPAAPDTALGDVPLTIVRIFDFDDGDALATNRFGAEPQPSAQGWTVVENGKNEVRVDSTGLFAVDEVFGDDEYNQACDLASPDGTCGYACAFGSSELSTEDLSRTRNALTLSGADAVITAKPVATFPSDAFTVSFWIRTTHRTPDACVLSYAAPGDVFSGVQLAVCDPTNLRLIVNSVRVSDIKTGLSTFVDVADGRWHFVAITWDADDGRVYLYDNGMLAFQGGPYRVGHRLSPGGFFALGQLVYSTSSRSACELSKAVSASGSSSTTRLSCLTADGRGTVASAQHVHLWSRVLTRPELLRELQWPMKVTTNGLILGWNFDAAFVHEDAGAMTVVDISTRGQDQKNVGLLQCQAGSSCLARGVLPTVNPSFPCGRVYSNLWHFAAPQTIVGALPQAYGGRLQFRLLAPSFNGSPRPRRGQVSIFSSSGVQISLALGGFRLPNPTSWTAYSVILREDFGWLQEPSGEPAPTELFRRVLSQATALWIRGDLWAYSAQGPGQEVVYINEVKLFAR
ncbi:hypothetical protein ATCC90586_007420 [Pythium insidiosum]|nr:hypothetical protein ATCC90586_007420 [Pythium insidiosum]